MPSRDPNRPSESRPRRARRILAPGRRASAVAVSIAALAVAEHRGGSSSDFIGCSGPVVNFNDPNAWAGGVVPGPMDTANFGSGLPAHLSFDASITNAALNVQNGTSISMQIGAANTYQISGAFQSLSGAVLSVVSGRLRAGSGAVQQNAALVSGMSGVVEVTNGGDLVLQSGGGLSISAGGRVETTASFRGPGTGRVRLMPGAGSGLVTDAGSRLDVGGLESATSFSVRRGADVTVAGDAALSSLMVDGAGSSISASSVTLNPGASSMISSGGLLLGGQEIGLAAGTTVTASQAAVQSTAATSGLSTPVLNLADGAVVSTTGAYTQALDGRLELTLFAGLSSAVSSGAPASLAGALAVTKAGAFTPMAGATFTMLSAPSVAGGFQAALLPAFLDNRFVRIVYAPNRVDLVVDLLSQTVAFAAEPPASFTPDTPTALAAGDFNGDLRPDLAVAITTGPATNGRVQVLLNSGNGGMGQWLGYGASVQFTVGRDPFAIVALDLDGDFDLDLVVANRADDNILVYFTNPTGGGPGVPTFSNTQTIPVGDEPSALAAGDLVGDTRPDVVVTNRASDNIMILSNSAGSLAVGSTHAVGDEPTSVDVGDMDNDKDLDICIGNEATMGKTSSVSTIANLPGNAFSAATDYPLEQRPRAVMWAALDADAFRDIVTVNNPGDSVGLLRNNQNATFAPAVHLPTGASPSGLVRLDLDGDSDSDIAMVADNSLAQRVVHPLRNNSQAPQRIVLDNPSDNAVPAAGSLLATADVNVDSRPDLIVVTSTGSTQVSLNQTMPAFVADLNSDDRVDAADLSALLASWGAPPPARAEPIAADLNRDGAVNTADLAILLGDWGAASARAGR